MGLINNELKMISGLAFTRAILRDVKLDIDQGMIILLDSKIQARTLGQIFEENLDGKTISKIKKRDGILNFEAGIYPLSGSEIEDAVSDFMAEKRFFPIITVGGILPYYMRESNYVVRVYELEGMKVFEQEYKKFRKYVINNVDYIRKQLDYYYKKLPEVRYFDRRSEYYTAFKSIMAVGFIWYTFYKKTSTEEKAEQFWEQYKKYSYKLVSGFREYQDCYEIETEFTELTWNYLRLHSDIQVCPVEGVSIEVQESMKKNTVILYDSDFYYFSEKLVKSICAPMLETIPVGELKVLLKDKGIIHCNDDGYTIKKRFGTSSGSCNRMRAMKIKKETLMSTEGLLLEEKYEHVSEKHENMKEELLCQK